MMASISSAEVRGQYRVVVLVAIPCVRRAERSGSRPFTRASWSLYGLPHLHTWASRWLPIVPDR